MAQRRTLISDGLFWSGMAAVLAGTMGGAIGFVFARFYGAGWVSGAALGALIFLIAAVILSRTANSVNLPPPNSLKPPMAPPGGKFQAPPGGKFQPRAQEKGSAPASASAERSAPPAAPAERPAAPHVAETGGETASKGAFASSAAVTSAAAAAREAMASDAGPVVSQTKKPDGLAGPREGGPDDLKLIKGVGPRIEEMLHSLGFYHFDQVAAWGPDEVAWVDMHLEGFNGRATRDEWVSQAKVLATVMP